MMKYLTTASFVLKTKGKVLPVTHEKTHLCVEYENGIIVKGEADIDSDLHEQNTIKKAFLEPPFLHILKHSNALRKAIQS